MSDITESWAYGFMIFMFTVIVFGKPCVNLLFWCVPAEERWHEQLQEPLETSNQAGMQDSSNQDIVQESVQESLNQAQPVYPANRKKVTFSLPAYSEVKF